MRHAYMDVLNLMLRLGGQYRRMHEPLLDWVQRAGGDAVLDLGSGGGGPMDSMLQAAESANLAMPKIVLSDLFPNLAHFVEMRDRYGAERVDFVAEPVPADAVPDGQPELRSICSAFHHLSPELAGRVVADAVTNGRGLVIIEPFQRDWRHFLMLLLSAPLAIFASLFAPFVAPRFRWGSLLFCTLLPLAPLMVHVDGMVSVLRMHRLAEIAEMIPADLRDEVEVWHGAMNCGPMRPLYVCLLRKPK